MRLLTLALVLLIAPPAGATNLPQSKEQQKCLAGVSKGTAGIAKLVSKGATGCIKQAAAPDGGRTSPGNASMVARWSCGRCAQMPEG